MARPGPISQLLFPLEKGASPTPGPPAGKQHLEQPRGKVKRVQVPAQHQEMPWDIGWGRVEVFNPFPSFFLPRSCISLG